MYCVALELKAALLQLLLLISTELYAICLTDSLPIKQIINSLPFEKRINRVGSQGAIKEKTTVREWIHLLECSQEAMDPKLTLI